MLLLLSVLRYLTPFVLVSPLVSPPVLPLIISSQQRLQEALGGRSKTCIIATVSPSILAVDDTVSTLNYAEQVIQILGRRRSLRSRLYIRVE